MSVGRRSDRAMSQVSQYDFDRLEQSVEFLINEHERLAFPGEALLAELVDRERTISRLEGRLEEERIRRTTAIEGVDKILSRMMQLQESVAAAAKAAS